MKKIYLALLLSLNLFAIALAKSPQTISYQAIVRGANGNIIQESNIGIKISILQNGDEVYSEERIEQSNKNGLLSFAIGDENGTSNQSIESIDWSKGNYTIRCEMDLQGGDNYSLSMTTPLTSVPYALYAETVSPDVLPKKVSELVNDKNFVSIEQLNTILNDRVNSKDNGAESEESPTITPLSIQLTSRDTAKWNAKLDNFTEQDPLFNNSVAAKISAKDTAKWNAKLDNFTEQDPLFSNSVAAKISAKDTAKWNAKLDNFTEQDPLFNNSVAAKISAKDTAKW
ncbi:MAG: hypothetical protein MJZ33_09215, partial [Paludibacteraceae bacterium]|nr:hypothetical protein [Paludibacteraceae bacterium]